MYDVLRYQEDGNEIAAISMSPDNFNEGRCYPFELNYNLGEKDHNLIPVLKDIIGTRCRFVSLDGFKNKLLYSVSVNTYGITLSYRDFDNESDTAVDFSIDLEDVFEALKANSFKIRFYIYHEAGEDNPKNNVKKGDTELIEAYDFSFDYDSDEVLVSVSTETEEADYIIN